MRGPHPDGEGAENASGRLLGEFVVGDRIGSGGFGAVYKARQLSLDRDAVINVLRVGDRGSRQIERFEREARLASQLDHPYAAHVYAFGSEPDGVLWIAMELVRGPTLREWINVHGPMPLAQLVPLFERLCEVVHTAHAMGLVSSCELSPTWSSTQGQGLEQTMRAALATHADKTPYRGDREPGARLRRSA